jgi:hypothetical protein
LVHDLTQFINSWAEPPRAGVGPGEYFFLDNPAGAPAKNVYIKSERRSVGVLDMV